MALGKRMIVVNIPCDRQQCFEGQGGSGYVSKWLEDWKFLVKAVDHITIYGVEYLSQPNLKISSSSPTRRRRTIVTIVLINSKVLPSSQLVGGGTSGANVSSVRSLYSSSISSPYSLIIACLRGVPLSVYENGLSLEDTMIICSDVQ